MDNVNHITSCFPFRMVARKLGGKSVALSDGGTSPNMHILHSQPCSGLISVVFYSACPFALFASRIYYCYPLTHQIPEHSYLGRGWLQTKYWTTSLQFSLHEHQLSFSNRVCRHGKNRNICLFPRIGTTQVPISSSFRYFKMSPATCLPT